MRSFKETLQQEFPRTPESFRQCVNNAVAEERRGGRKHFHFAKTAIPVAACLILVCGTVTAAELPRLHRWLDSLGVNRQEAEEIIIRIEDGQPAVGHDSMEQDATGQETPFTVTDVYYDGATLLFLAEAGEERKELAFGDHVYINGTDNRLEYVVEIEEGSGIWQCEVTVMDEKLAESDQEKLDVTVQVYMETGEKQDYTFTIESGQLGGISTAADQRYELPYGIVEVSDIQTAPSKVSFTLHWKIYNEEAFAILRTTTFFWEDSSGTRYAPNELHMNSFCSPETRNPETGWIEFEQSFEIRNFDSKSEFIKIIPFEGGFDEEGAYIEGTETPREDMGFAVQF